MDRRSPVPRRGDPRRCRPTLIESAPHGYEAARRIRRELGARTPPIIAVTTRAMEQDRLDCQAAGMDEVITKPISLQVPDAVLRRRLPASGEPTE